MRLIVAAALMFAATPLFAASMDVPSGKYEIDPAHASVTWKIRHFGLSNYTARFIKPQSTVVLDATDVAKSKLDVTIPVSSVRTDYPFPEKVDFDKELATDPKFLGGTANPMIRFVSTGIKMGTGQTAKVSGQLTLNGVTKPVVLDVLFNGTRQPSAMAKVPGFGVSATTVVKRSDFGLTFGQGFLGDEVQLAIEAEYKQAS